MIFLIFFVDYSDYSNNMSWKSENWKMRFPFKKWSLLWGASIVSSKELQMEMEHQIPAPSRETSGGKVCVKRGEWTEEWVDHFPNVGWLCDVSIWLLYFYFFSSLIISYHSSENTQSSRNSKPNQQSKHKLIRRLKITILLKTFTVASRFPARLWALRLWRHIPLLELGHEGKLFFFRINWFKVCLYRRHNKYIHKKCLYRSSPCASLILKTRTFDHSVCICVL